MNKQHTTPAVKKTPSRVKSLIKTILPFVLLLLAFVIVMSVMNAFKQEPAKVPPKPDGFLVELSTVEPSDHAVTIYSQGTLQAKRQITLSSEVSAAVLELSPQFSAGSRFAKGDVLVTLDPADYRVAVQRAKAGLASARATLELEQARSEQAMKDWKSFAKKGKPSELLLNIPQLNGAKANVKSALADLAKAERDLSKTKVIAPFDGVVLSKAVDVGQFVISSGQLGQIAGRSIGEVRLSLSDVDVERLDLLNTNLDKKPLPVKIFNAGGVLVSDGRLARLEAGKDARTLLNYAIVEIDNPLNKGLFFNDFLYAEIEAKPLSKVFAIPIAWLMSDDRLGLFEEGQLNLVQLKILYRNQQFAYVSEGIDSNDLIVTTPIQSAQQGMKLRPAKTHQPTPENTGKTAQPVEQKS